MHIIRPSRAIGLLALVALIACAALAMLTPPADAAAKTLYACQKKKGGALRIVTKSKKCRKTEKKIAWAVSGPQGDQGPAGPSAVRFSGSGSPGGLLTASTIASFSAGGVDFRVRCVNLFVGNVVTIEAKSAAAATTTAAGILAKGLDDNTKPGLIFKRDALVAGADFSGLDGGVANASGPAENQAIVTYVIDTGTKTVTVHAALSVLSTCTASGWASAA